MVFLCFIKRTGIKILVRKRRQRGRSLIRQHSQTSSLLKLAQICLKSIRTEHQETPQQNARPRNKQTHLLYHLKYLKKFKVFLEQGKKRKTRSTRKMNHLKQAVKQHQNKQPTQEQLKRKLLTGQKIGKDKNLLKSQRQP